MVNTKMKIKKKAICIVLSLLLLSSCIVFFLSHKTYYKYNDWWIIGRSYDEVVKRYGEFDCEYGSEKGYYIKKDNSIIMPSHQDYYYWMIFDENGIITEVYIAAKPGG